MSLVKAAVSRAVEVAPRREAPKAPVRRTPSVRVEARPYVLDKADIIQKALAVAKKPELFAQLPPQERPQVDEVVKALSVGSGYVAPQKFRATPQKRPHAQSASVVALRAHSVLSPSSTITPVDIAVALHEQGMDFVQPFAPGTPLQPFYGYNRPPRLRDYQIGRNIGTDTRIGRIPYITLDRLYKSYDIAQDCFAPGTLIVAKRGLVPIEDIEVGEEVLTHLGRWRRVRETMVRPVRPDEAVYEVSAGGLDTLTVTGNHPMLVARYTHTQRRSRVARDFGFVDVADIEERGNAKQANWHYDAAVLPALADESADGFDVLPWLGDGFAENDEMIVRPGPGGGRFVSIPARLAYSEELGRVLGWYLAEGSQSHDRSIGFVLGPDEEGIARQLLDDIEAVFGVRGRYAVSHVARGFEVFVSNSAMSRLFKCGTAATKRIPEWAWAGGPQFLRAVLDAWALGDGWTSERNGWAQRTGVATASYSLAWEMRLVAISLGLAPSIIKKPGGHVSTIRGGECRSSEIYHVEWAEKPQRWGRWSFEQDGRYLATAIRTVVRVPYEGCVHNLSVEEDESYVTTGGAVHNCTRHSINTLRAMVRSMHFGPAEGYERYPAKEIIEVRNRLRRPDGKMFFANWLAQNMLDLWKYDSAPIYRFRDAAGNVTKLQNVSAPCYSDDTEVLTEAGWKRFAEVDISADRFATRNPETKAFEWQRAYGQTALPFEGDLLHFHSNAMDLLVTPDHRMLLTSLPRKLGGNSHRSGEVFVLAGDVERGRSEMTAIPTTSRWVGHRIDKFELLPASAGYEMYATVTGLREARVTRGLSQSRAEQLVGVAHQTFWSAEKGHRVRSTTAKALLAEFPDIDVEWAEGAARPALIPGDVFCAFMGAWLAEGSIGGTNGDTVFLTQFPTSKGYEPFREMLSALLGSEPGRDGASWHFKWAALATYLRQFGHSHDKFVPSEVLNASPDQLRIFWHFYMLGDGYLHDGSEAICTTSTRMADHLQEVAQKMGFWASVRVKRTSGNLLNGKWIRPGSCYVITLRRPKKALIRAIDHVPYLGTVHCVSVPNGTLYVRRNGRPSWCGNCIEPMLDYYGGFPDAPAPAFQQYIQGVPWDDLTWDNLIYAPFWPETESPYGTPPLETMMLNANFDVRMQVFMLQFFTSGSVPEALAIAPEGLTSGDDLGDFEEQYYSYFQGDQSERYGLHWLPHGTEIVQYKPQQFDPDLAEYAMRRTCSAHLVSPHNIGITDATNRCYDEATEVLTEHGWKRHDDVLTGERIATVNPATRAIEYHVPSAHHVYDFDGELVHFTSRNVDVLVTPNHRMWVGNRSHGLPRGCSGAIRPSWEFAEADALEGRSDVWFADSAVWDQGAEIDQFTLPGVAGKLRGGGFAPRPADRTFSMDAWLEFLGYVVSEGCIYGDGNGCYLVNLSQSERVNPEKVRTIQACLDQLPIRAKRPANVDADGTVRWQINDKSLWTWLRANLGHKSGDKRLPDLWRSLGKRQLSILFEAMMLGDGHTDTLPNATWRSYFTKSDALANDAQEVALRLGYRAQVRFSQSSRVNVVSLAAPSVRGYQIRWEKNVTRVPYVGKVWCFTVENHLFITRRNGKVGIHGNSVGDTQMDVEEKVLDVPLAGYYEALLDSVIQEDWGFPVSIHLDVRVDRKDELQEAQARQIYWQMAALRNTDVRMKLGFPVDPREQGPLGIMDQRLGWSPMSHAIAIAGDIDEVTGMPKPGSVEPVPYELPGGGNPPPAAGPQDQGQPQGGGASPKVKRDPTKAYPRPPRNVVSKESINDEPPNASPGYGLGLVSGSARNSNDLGFGVPAKADIPWSGIPGYGTAAQGSTAQGTGAIRDPNTPERELSAWRRQSRNRVKAGKSPRWFETNTIGLERQNAIWEKLEGAQSIEQVDAAFKAAEEPRVAGIAVRAKDTGRVLLLQRALEPV